MLACLPPSFLSPVSGAINSFAFAVKCFACLMSLTFHSDDSFSFCSADMSTPCMSPHVHDPFGRGYFFLPFIHTSSRQAGSLRCSRLIHSTIDGSKWTATNSVGKLKKLQEKNEIPIRLSVAVRRHRHHQLSSGSCLTGISLFGD